MHGARVADQHLAGVAAVGVQGPHAPPRVEHCKLLLSQVHQARHLHWASTCVAHTHLCQRLQQHVQLLLKRVGRVDVVEGPPAQDAVVAPRHEAAVVHAAIRAW